MAVRLSVPDRCTVSADPLDFSDGATKGGPALAQSSVALACTVPTLYRIALDSGENGAFGERRLLDPEKGSYVSYEIYRDPARAARWGDRPGTETVDGRLASAGVARHIAYGRIETAGPLEPGAYRDTLVVTVHF